VVLHFPVFNDAAMPVVGVFAEANIRHNQQIQIGAANRLDRALHDTIRRIGFGAERIFFFRDAEQNNSRNAKLLHLAALLKKSVDRLLRDAGHRSNRIPDIFARAHEHRIDESARRQARFSRQGANRFAAPQPSRSGYRKTHTALAFESHLDEKRPPTPSAMDAAVASAATMPTGKPASRNAADVTGPAAAS